MTTFTQLTSKARKVFNNPYVEVGEPIGYYQDRPDAKVAIWIPYLDTDREEIRELNAKEILFNSKREANEYLDI